jgi:hypothetical protein
MVHLGEWRRLPHHHLHSVRCTSYQGAGGSNLARQWQRLAKRVVAWFWCSKGVVEGSFYRGGLWRVEQRLLNRFQLDLILPTMSFIHLRLRVAPVAWCGQGDSATDGERRHGGTHAQEYGSTTRELSREERKWAMPW